MGSSAMSGETVATARKGSGAPVPEADPQHGPVWRRDPRAYTRPVHPIERLRYVARSQGAPASLLVQESAGALGAFWDDPAGLVAASRRIIDRQLTCGPLWWLCARLLCSTDPRTEARDSVSQMADDPTERHLAHELPTDATVVVVGWPDQAMSALARRGDVEVLVVDSDGEAYSAVRRLESVDVVAFEVPARSAGAAVAMADLVLLEAAVAGPTETLASSGSRAAASVAKTVGVPVWLVAGVGRMLPGRMWDPLLVRWTGVVEPLDSAEEVVPLDLVDRIAGVDGVLGVDDALTRTDCPIAPELFRLVG